MVAATTMTEMTMPAALAAAAVVSEAEEEEAGAAAVAASEDVAAVAAGLSEGAAAAAVEAGLGAAEAAAAVAAAAAAEAAAAVVGLAPEGGEDGQVGAFVVEVEEAAGAGVGEGEASAVADDKLLSKHSCADRLRVQSCSVSAGAEFYMPRTRVLRVVLVTARIKHDRSSCILYTFVDVFERS